MGNRRTSLLQPVSTAISGDEPDTHQLIALLESAVHVSTYDSNPKLWDDVLTDLNLDLCYQLTVAEVLRQGRWRNAKNPRAYITSAAVRSARRKQLPDYSEKEFRRAPSDEPNSDTGTRIDSAAGFDLEEWGGGGVYKRTASGAMRYVEDAGDGDYREIPRWLQRGNEYDTIDWETVAAYAAVKPRMACQLARTLIMRLELRIGRPAAMARGKSNDEAAAKELKENRNLAAHASDQAFDRDDAEDLFDFAIAICEYVFVLTERFDAFKKRRQNKKAAQQEQQS